MIHFTTKYSSAVATLFSKESFVKPHTNGNLDFQGAKTVRVYMLNPAKLNDYKRSGSNRFGEVKDVEDNVLEYTMTQDKSWTSVVDNGDASDQAIADKASKFTKVMTRQVVTPEADKYALRRFLTFGKTLSVDAAPDKTTVIDQFVKLQSAFDNAMVPDSQRIVFVPVSVFALIATSDEFIKIRTLGEKSIAKGEVGELFGFKVIKVPDSYMPADCFALAIYKPAVAMPYKLNELRANKDAPGYSGTLMESRQYYDAFVLGEKADGVVGLVLKTKKLAAPTINTGTKTAVAITCSGATEIKYTTDGSDPRFSMTAKVYGSPFDGTGLTVKAVGFDDKNTKFTSDIATAEVAK